MSAAISGLPKSAVVFELLVLRLRDIKGETAATMRARHTNLE